MSYNFIADWSKSAKKNAEYILSKYTIAPKRTMEVGVFEGQFTLWLVDNYPSIVEHIGIDSYRGNYEVDDTLMDIAYDRWVENLNKCRHSHKVNFYKQPSQTVLKELQGEFDFIYIDGDHTAAAVLEDLVLSFSLVKSGGVILCDDAVSWKYTHHSTKVKSDNLALSPRLAVDSFIHCNWHRLDIIDLPASNQLAFVKK